MLEDVNVEHMLNVFASIDANSETIWNACIASTVHLYWYRPLLIMFGSNIEALPDDHPSKARCLSDLSRLLGLIGNRVESKRLLTHALRLCRQRGDDFRIAQTLGYLSDINRRTDFTGEGIRQTKEASEIFKRLGNPISLIFLASALCVGKQLDAAEEAGGHISFPSTRMSSSLSTSAHMHHTDHFPFQAQK